MAKRLSEEVLLIGGPFRNAILLKRISVQSTLTFSCKGLRGFYQNSSYSTTVIGGAHKTVRTMVWQNEP